MSHSVTTTRFLTATALCDIWITVTIIHHKVSTVS